MGLTKINQNLYSRALTFFQKALDIRVGIYGEADPSVRDTYSIMGFTEAASGDLDGALRKLGDALRVSQLLGDRLKEAETLSNIGNAHREKEEWELALEHYDDCMSIRIAELGRDHESVADALMAIGNVKSDMSKQEDAVKSYKDGESDLRPLSFQFCSAVSYTSFRNSASNLVESSSWKQQKNCINYSENRDDSIPWR
jgi:tetratricopeptide (TPR) repeat protein